MGHAQEHSSVIFMKTQEQTKRSYEIEVRRNCMSTVTMVTDKKQTWSIFGKVNKNETLKSNTTFINVIKR